MTQVASGEAGRANSVDRSSPAPLVELLAALSLVLAILVVHGALAAPVRLGRVTLAQPDLGDWYHDAPDSVVRSKPFRTSGPSSASPPPARPSLPARLLAAAPTSRRRATGAEERPRSHRILMLGDSMIETVQGRASAYAHGGEHRFISVIWYGSRTIDWGRGQRLAEVLHTYAPTYVIIVLGSNELSVRNIERRAPAVRAMAKTLGEIPFVWIGPPSWREDTGLVALLAAELGSRFFDSALLTFERKSDGIHPTNEAGVRWMDAIAQWLQTRDGALQLALTAPPDRTRRHAPARVWPPPGR